MQELRKRRTEIALAAKWINDNWCFCYFALNAFL